MMENRFSLSLVALLAGLLALSSAGLCSAEEKKGQSVKAKLPAALEMDDAARKLLDRIAEAKAGAIPRDEQPVVPDAKRRLKTRHYALTDAFEATGYRVEALRKKLGKSAAQSQSHVELESWDGSPEMAKIYDDAGIHVNTVVYFWNSHRTVYGAAFKSASDRLLRMYRYCRGADALYAHDLSSFRIHAPFTRKLSVVADTVTVELVDGHAPDGSLWMWPQCRQLALHQERAQAYQSPGGLHRQVFRWDSEGNLVEQARYDREGKLVKDHFGIARRSWKWSGEELAEEAAFSDSGLLAAYRYSYDDGRREERTRIDGNGTPVGDFLGVATYRYEYDDQGRVTSEVRVDQKGGTIEVHTFAYGILDQVSKHAVATASGEVLTTYVHNYDKRGARVRLSVHAGDPAKGKLKVDPNGVAEYRFQYNKRGRMTRASRHGTRTAAGADGTADLVLVNARDGWAVAEYEYDSKGTGRTGVRHMQVDDQGQPVNEETRKGETGSAWSLTGTPPAAVALRTLSSILKATVTATAYEAYKRRLDDRARKEGRLRLRFSPEDTRVTVVQRRFVQDPFTETALREWAPPVELPETVGDEESENSDGEFELEELPISEEGRLCPADDTIYPASQQYCPTFVKCREESYWEAHQDQCVNHKLKRVTRCLADGSYRLVLAPGSLTCADGKTLADPAQVPVFTYRYEILLESEGHYPAVFTVREQDWLHVGSGNHVVAFPRGLTLLRQWGTTATRFATVKQQMRCWRLDWEDALDEQTANFVSSRVAAALEQQATTLTAQDAVYEGVRRQYQAAVAAKDEGRTIEPQVLRRAQEVLQNYEEEIERYLKTEAESDKREAESDGKVRKSNVARILGRSKNSLASPASGTRSELALRVERSGHFLEYLVAAYLTDQQRFEDALARFAKSRQADYESKRAPGSPSEAYHGLRRAVELAWWTGSKAAFDDWYYRLWAKDVQSCLNLARKLDPSLYTRGLANFKKAVEKKRTASPLIRPESAARYVYLLDLVRLQDMVDIKEFVPVLQEVLRLDWGLYVEQNERLRAWAHTRSTVFRKYHRGHLLATEASRQPAKVQKALEKRLQLDDTMGLLLANLEAMREGALMGVAADAMRQMQDELYPQFRKSYAEHVQQRFTVYQKDARFVPDRWEPLEKELSASGSHGEWAEALELTLKNRRPDCEGVTYTIPEAFLESMRGQSWE